MGGTEQQKMRTDAHMATSWPATLRAECDMPALLAAHRKAHARHRVSRVHLLGSESEKLIVIRRLAFGFKGS